MTLHDLRNLRNAATDTLAVKQLTTAIELVEFQRRIYGDDFASVVTIGAGWPGSIVYHVRH
jgi:hypothetical protein